MQENVQKYHKLIEANERKIFLQVLHFTLIASLLLMLSQPHLVVANAERITIQPSVQLSLL